MFDKLVQSPYEKMIVACLTAREAADLENIQVAEEDKDAEYEKLAKQYGVELDSVKTFFDVDLFESSLRVMKAANCRVDNSVALPEPEEKPEDKAEEKTEEKAEDKAEDKAE